MVFLKEADEVSNFQYRGEEIFVEWFWIDKKEDIPDLPWQTVHVIGDFNGKVPIVEHTSGRKGLPGGHVEPGESLEETLIREINEELNMKVVWWSPIGFQKVTNPRGRVDYQFRVAAEFEKKGEFIEDIGGSVIGYSLEEYSNVNDLIKYSDLGDKIIKRALDLNQK